MRAACCEATVLSHEVVAGDIRLLRALWPDREHLPHAGQFFTLRAWGADEAPFLSRPISVHKWEPKTQTIEFLYQVHRIIRVEMLKLLRNFLFGHIVEKLLAVVLIELHQHLGGSLFVEQLIQKFCIFHFKVVKELRYVGRVQVAEQPPCSIFILARHDVFDIL